MGSAVIAVAIPDVRVTGVSPEVLQECRCWKIGIAPWPTDNPCLIGWYLTGCILMAMSHRLGFHGWNRDDIRWQGVGDINQVDLELRHGVWNRILEDGFHNRRRRHSHHRDRSKSVGQSRHRHPADNRFGLDPFPMIGFGLFRRRNLRRRNLRRRNLRRRNLRRRNLRRRNLRRRNLRRRNLRRRNLRHPRSSLRHPRSSLRQS